MSVLIVLTQAMFQERIEANGGIDGGGIVATWEEIMEAATTSGVPIGVHLATSGGETTAFIPPRGWSQERLAGFVAGKHEELAEAFGDILSMDSTQGPMKTGGA